MTPTIKLLPLWTTVERLGAELDHRFARIMKRRPMRPVQSPVMWINPAPFPEPVERRPQVFLRADAHFRGMSERHLARMPT